MMKKGKGFKPCKGCPTPSRCKKMGRCAKRTGSTY